MIHQRKERISQTGYPRDRSQQGKTHQHRAHQTNATCAGLLVFWQFSDHQRKENDVINTQHHLKDGQGAQRQPGVGIGNPLKHTDI